MNNVKEQRNSTSSDVDKETTKSIFAYAEIFLCYLTFNQSKQDF
jgi:hypothetical protein